VTGGRRGFQPPLKPTESMRALATERHSGRQQSPSAARDAGAQPNLPTYLLLGVIRDPYALTPANSLRRIIASNRGNPPSVSHSGSGTGFPVTTVDESNVALPVTSPV